MIIFVYKVVVNTKLSCLFYSFFIVLSSFMRFCVVILIAFKIEFCIYFWFCLFIFCLHSLLSVWFSLDFLNELWTQHFFLTWNQTTNHKWVNLHCKKIFDTNFLNNLPNRCPQHDTQASLVFFRLNRVSSAMHRPLQACSKCFDASVQRLYAAQSDRWNEIIVKEASKSN